MPGDNDQHTVAIRNGQVDVTAETLLGSDIIGKLESEDLTNVEQFLENTFLTIGNGVVSFRSSSSGNELIVEITIIDQEIPVGNGTTTALAVVVKFRIKKGQAEIDPNYNPLYDYQPSPILVGAAIAILAIPLLPKVATLGTAALVISFFTGLFNNDDES